jgi:hypothetical protein
MKLNVLERLMILSVLPKEGDYARLKLLNNLKMSMSFSEEEINKWGIVSDLERNQTNWKENGESEIPIGEKATDIIIETLKELNRTKKLHSNLMGVYEKFIPTNE